MTKKQDINDILDKKIDKDDEIVGEIKKETKESDLIRSFKTARNVTDKKKMDLPEELALKYDMTFKQMVDFIESTGKSELRNEWILYKEALKVKFALSDRDSMKDIQSNYNLGMDSKSLPEIGFYFGTNERMNKALEAIIVQTHLQREKNSKEAQNMGIEVMTNEEKRELSELISEFDETD